jgi:uncharacterized protein (TIGR02145 family)
VVFIKEKNVLKKLILYIGIIMLSINTSYGEETVQDIEGNEYKTVKIGNQIWLADNLRTTKFQDGSPVKTGFIPDDKDENLLKYGRLYNWHDVADERNICPIGFRVATDDDWKELEKTIGMSEVELDKDGWRGEGTAIILKEEHPDTLFTKFDKNEINKYNFTVRPAGIKWGNWYITQGLYTEFWTATEFNAKRARNRTFAHYCLNPNKGKIYRDKLSKYFMFSVRCVKE